MDLRHERNSTTQVQRVTVLQHDRHAHFAHCETSVAPSLRLSTRSLGNDSAHAHATGG